MVFLLFSEEDDLELSASAFDRILIGENQKKVLHLESTVPAGGFLQLYSFEKRINISGVGSRPAESVNN